MIPLHEDAPFDHPRDPFSARDALLSWMEEIAPYGIFTTDGTLRIQSWNRWLSIHSGLSADQVIGRNLLEVFPDVETRRLDERYRRALGGEVSLLSAALHRFLLPFPAIVSTGAPAQMLQTVRIAPLPSGELVVGTITIIEDVTEREHQAVALQRQQEHDRLLSTALGILLQSADPMKDVADLFPTIAPSLRIEAYFNHIFDVPSQSLVLSTAAGLGPKQKESLLRFNLGEGPCGPSTDKREATLVPSLQSNADPRYQELRAGGIRLFCCFPLLIAGELLGTMAVASYSRENFAPDEVSFLTTLAQYIAIAMDRAKRESLLRKAEQRLREHAEILESKVSERTLRLHDTIVQLESFSYTIAHDLRAPIRSLKGYAEVLTSDFGHLLPPEGRMIVDRLQRAGNRLDALTRDLLLFSQIGHEPFQLEPVDVDELLRDLVLMTPRVDQALTVQGTLGRAWAQRTLLQQCLSNLCDNAMKFVAPGIAPKITIRGELRGSSTTLPAPSTRPPFHSATKAVISSGSPFPTGEKPSTTTAREWLRIWIEDNGIGVPAHAHEKIFGIFERLNNLESVEGTGIGLAIVARAMQQMNGSCGVESEVGKGSRFWIELPVA